ncbi:hypothetical protein M0Q50_08915 [bacterium]|jgi:hypothetical protein|nr:hypothetical protein [bacterium]
MSLSKCPKCGKDSLIKSPSTRIMTEKLGSMVHTSNEYSYICLDNVCAYRSDIIREKTELGEKLSLPWYKRLFI